MESVKRQDLEEDLWATVGCLEGQCNLRFLLTLFSGHQGTGSSPPQALAKKYHLILPRPRPKGS